MISALIAAALVAAAPAENAPPVEAPAGEAAPAADSDKESASLAAAVDPTTMDEAVAVALGRSGRLLEARGKVEEWEARLAEVNAIYKPKITALGYVAPMFRVNAPEEQVPAGVPSEVRFLLDEVDADLSSWGPYLHLEALAAWPVYSFGRVEAGRNAAKNRILVEEARYRQLENEIALEVRRYYLLHLYARTLLPALNNGRDLLAKALTAAQEQYEEGAGTVTQVDLQKLTYFSTELDKFLVQAETGRDLALAALKHTMGLPDAAPLVVADELLPDAPDMPILPLPQLVKLASERRPEVDQIVAGRKAALSLEDAERLANLPVVAIAGQFTADWTPMREDAESPYIFDPFNRVFGGVALALQWQFDPWLASARGDGAEAVQKQVEGLARFAETGIPVQVRQFHDETVQAQRLTEITKKGSVAARKWMIFAGAAYSAGTGEAKDLLEGLGAYLQSRKNYFDQLLALHTSRAALLYATGGAQDPASILAAAGE